MHEGGQITYHLKLDELLFISFIEISSYLYYPAASVKRKSESGLWSPYPLKKAKVKSRFCCCQRI